MRSALAAVEGVSQTTVSFEGHEARVAYDPSQCSVADLLAAVERASDPASAMTFRATLKK